MDFIGIVPEPDELYYLGFNAYCYCWRRAGDDDKSDFYDSTCVLPLKLFQALKGGVFRPMTKSMRYMSRAEALADFDQALNGDMLPA